MQCSEEDTDVFCHFWLQHHPLLPVSAFCLHRYSVVNSAVCSSTFFYFNLYLPSTTSSVENSAYFVFHFSCSLSFVYRSVPNLRSPGFQCMLGSEFLIVFEPVLKIYLI